MPRRHVLLLLTLATLAQGCSAELRDILGLPPLGEGNPSPQSPPTASNPSAPLPSAMVRPSTAPSLAPGVSPKPGTPSPNQPKASPGASAQPLPALPPGERSQRDRPDEVEGHQIQALYVLPSDTKDEQLDTNGSIERSIAAMNRWMESQAKASFRVDTFQGRPDIAFVRLPFAESQAREGNGQVAQDKIIEAVANAGFLSPNKTYAIWYGGPADRGESCDAGGGATTGRGGGGYAALYLRACGSNVPGGDPNGNATGADLTIAHEIVHALGFVADCAPHAGQGGHTTDDESDLMAASGGDPSSTVLDPGHDDYFGHGRPGCLDLARSTFLNPMPSGALAPLDRPMVMALPASAEAVSLGSNGPDGDAALEASVLEKMQADRKAAGKAELPVPDALQHAARRMALSTALNEDVDLGAATSASGYAGPVGANFIGAGNLNLGVSDLTSGFGPTPPWMAADAKELAVAVVKKNGRLGFAVAIGKGKARLDSIRMAAGPVNTRSLALRIRLNQGTPASRIHLKVNDEFYVPNWAVSEGGSVEVFASVPNSGKSTVTVLLQNGAVYQRSAGSLPVLATLSVDGGADAASAVRIQP